MRAHLLLPLVLVAPLGCANRRSEAVAAEGAAPADPQKAPAGVDLAKLDDGERKIFFRVAGKVPSACGKAHSLLQSAERDPSCRRSIFALRYAARLADEGFLESEISEQVEKRYLQKPASLDLTQAPVKGDPKAPITIVEFADFECPHCKSLQPLLDRLLDEYKGQVRIYFKNFPLRSHSHAENAALAVAAAQKQGKFWAMSAKLWQNQEALSPPDLERYAKEAGLDLKKWKEDFGSSAVKERVAKDRSDGDSLDIQGTPVVYINGRQWAEGTKDYDTLKGWVEEELGLLR